MKAIKLFSVALALAFATTANAQFVKSGGNKTGGGLSSDPEYADSKSVTNEIDIYLQDGWGLGYQVRGEINQYLGYNAFGVSYMSGFVSPADFGQVNIRGLGARGYTPAYKSIRGYVDLNMGYTMVYARDWWDDIQTSHNFGLDFSVGVQLHKNFAIGYNLNFIAPVKAKSHWARIAFLF